MSKVHFENLGQALLYKLRALGTDFLFANPGSEFVSIIDGLERFQRDGIAGPRPITAPHEQLAVNMAYGAYLVTGRPQAVMGHVNVGMANSLIGLIGAARMNIPILYLAGRTPLRESGHRGQRDRFVHWAQEARDQATMLREYVKWDYELRSADMLEPVLERAWAIAMSEPRGPVCLSLPRELLLEPFEGTLDLAKALHPASPPRPEKRALARVVALLAAASRPLIVTSRSGADPGCVGALQRLSERLTIPVATPHAHYLCFPADHPHYLGDRPERLLKLADFVLVLDTDVPWCPLGAGPLASTPVVEVGADPLHAAIPVRSHRADVVLHSGIAAFLTDLLAHTVPPDPSLAAKRQAWIAAQREPPGAAASQVQVEALDAAFVARALAEVFDEDTVLVNELSLPAAGLPLRAPGSYYRAGSASALGWALGCSLGIKLAAPRKKVVSVVGDGVYYLCNPLAAHWIEAAYSAPTLTLVLNNGGLGSISSAVDDFYPRADAARKRPLTSLEPRLQFEKVMTALGGYGEAVTLASELRSALGRGTGAVSRGEAALLNIFLQEKR